MKVADPSRLHANKSPMSKDIKTTPRSTIAKARPSTSNSFINFVENYSVDDDQNNQYSQEIVDQSIDTGISIPSFRAMRDSKYVSSKAIKRPHSSNKLL